VTVRFVDRDVDALLVVDTGAQRTLIRPRLALRLGVDTAQPLRWERLVGVGETQPVPVVQLARVQVGSSLLNGLLASVYDFSPGIPADGLLGPSFLSHFRATFEFDTETLVLRATL